MKRTAALGLSAAIAVSMAGCSASDDTAATLPAAVMHADEDGPATLEDAIKGSDYVVVGEIVGERSGARFYGGDEREDLSESRTWIEDVEFAINVEEYISGDGSSSLLVRWPSYFSSEPALGHRVADLDFAANDVELAIGKRYVLFLTDFGDPWGLTGTSHAASVIELDEMGQAVNRSDLFERVNVDSVQAVREAS